MNTENDSSKSQERQEKYARDDKLVDIELIPPRRYNLKQYPKQVEQWTILYFLGKAVEDGLISSNDVKDILEKIDVERLQNLLFPHVIGVSKKAQRHYFKKAIKRTLKLVSLAVKGVKDIEDHDNIIAHTFGKCPSCGSSLKPSQLGLKCEKCKIVYKEPLAEPPSVENVLGSSKEIKMEDFIEQSEHPHIFPILLLKQKSKGNVIVLNPKHPLIRILKGK